MSGIEWWRVKGRRERRAELAREIQEELAFHQAEEIERRVAAGTSPDAEIPLPSAA